MEGNLTNFMFLLAIKVVFMKTKINNRVIGSDERPFIIAEMSANHNGSLRQALETVKAASDAGADAIKLQTYSADTITLDSDNFLIRMARKGSGCLICIKPPKPL